MNDDKYQIHFQRILSNKYFSMQYFASIITISLKSVLFSVFLPFFEESMPGFS